MQEWINAHPQVAGGIMFLAGLAIVGYEEGRYRRHREPDGCVSIFAIAFIVAGFLGAVGIIR